MNHKFTIWGLGRRDQAGIITGRETLRAGQSHSDSHVDLTKMSISPEYAGRDDGEQL